MLYHLNFNLLNIYILKGVCEYIVKYNLTNKQYTVQSVPVIGNSLVQQKCVAYNRICLYPNLR